MINDVFYQICQLVILILRPFDFSTERACSQFNGLLPKPNSCGYSQLRSIYSLCNILILFMLNFNQGSDCGQTGLWATARQDLTPFAILAFYEIK